MNRLGIYVWDKTSYKPYIGEIKYNKLYAGDNLIFQSIAREEEDTSRIEVILNDEWQPMTENIPFPENVLGDAYESFSNHNIPNSVAKMRIVFENVPEFKIWYRSDAESQFDYVVVSKIDTELPSSPSDSSKQVEYNTKSKQNTWFEAIYDNDGAEHFIEIAYRKDSSTDIKPDKGFVLLPRHRNILGIKWTLTDDYICDMGDKYEKMVKEIQYDNPVEWVTTKEYQKGELLEKGSADCEWVRLSFETPKDTPFTKIRIDFKKISSNVQFAYRFVQFVETPGASRTSTEKMAFSAYYGSSIGNHYGEVSDPDVKQYIDVVGTLVGDQVYEYTFSRTYYLWDIQQNVPVEAIEYQS